MKCYEVGTNKHAEVSVKADEVTCTEYNDYVDANGAICCWIPLEDGKKITIFCKIFSTSSALYLDLMMDGILRNSKTFNSKGDKPLNRKHTFDFVYYKHSKLLKKAEAYASKFDHPVNMAEGEHESVGVIEVRVSLTSDSKDVHKVTDVNTFNEVETWNEQYQRPNYMPGFHHVQPTQEIRFRDIDDSVLTVSQRSTLLKNIKEPRPGAEPWAIFRFHYRPQALLAEFQRVTNEEHALGLSMATNAEDHPKANGTPNSLGHADLTDIIVPPTRSATEDTQCFKLNNGSVKNNDESATRRAASEFEPTSLRTLQGQPNAEVKKRATQAKNKGWKESIGMDIASNTLTAKAQKVRGRSNKQSMPTASPRHSLGSSTSQPNETQKRGQMSESITSSTHPTDCVVQTHGEKEATELMAESSDHSIVEQEAESIRNGQVKVVKLSSPKPDANGGVLVSQAPETNGVEFDLNIFGIDDLFSPTSVCSNVTLDNIVVKMPESIGDLEGPLLDPSTPSPSSTQKIDTVTTPTLTLEQDNSSKDIMMTPPPTNGKRSSLCDDTTPTQRKNKKVKVESSLTELERQIAERKRILEEKKAKTAAMKKLAAEAKAKREAKMESVRVKQLEELQKLDEAIEEEERMAAEAEAERIQNEEAYLSDDVDIEDDSDHDHEGSKN